MTADCDGNEYILNGQKLSFSRAANEYFAVVIARTGNGYSCFLVDKGTPGFTVSGGKETQGWKPRYLSSRTHL